MQFKIFVQWFRFVNVMIIAGLFIGILTYYTTIKTIYWLTKVEKKKKKLAEKKKQKRLQQSHNKSPVLYGLLDKEDEAFWSSTDVKPNKIFEDIVPDRDELNSALDTDNNDDDYDDIYNYGSLNSLKRVSNENSSRSEISTIRSRNTVYGSGSDSNQGTGTTSIFSRLNLTPITTIEEDDEQEDQYKH